MPNTTPVAPNPLEELAPANSKMGRAFQRAEAGEFDKTLFEHWQGKIQTAIDAGTPEGVGMDVIASLLGQFPWLGYKDIGRYIELRNEMLAEGMELLKAAYPKPEKFLFKENIGDWVRHKDAYMKVLVDWAVMTTKWALDWKSLPFEDPDKAVKHAVVLELTVTFIGKHGLTELAGNLAEYEITDEDAAAMQKAVAEALGIEEGDDE